MKQAEIDKQTEKREVQKNEADAAKKKIKADQKKEE